MAKHSAICTLRDQSEVWLKPKVTFDFTAQEAALISLLHMYTAELIMTGDGLHIYAMGPDNKEAVVPVEMYIKLLPRTA